ncbi:Tigger transposable element-derived protein 6 [Cucumispora dikerogammari]|nr:Tigger transposable element-derived protein 6 [Cucumispora dikerogammari]
MDGLQNLKKRHNLQIKKISGEAGLVDKNNIINFKRVYEEKLRQYQSSNVFYCDKTGLFWRQNHSSTFTLDKNDLASRKLEKERLTILFCVSLEGEKITPLVIEKSRKPRSFGNRNINALNLTYRHTKKAWMSLLIFKEWLDNLNSDMKKMNRKILLPLDNAPVHSIDTTYTHIGLFYFPQGGASQIQPCGQGIIKSFKSHYKKMLSNKILFDCDSSENEKPDCTDLLKKITIYGGMWFIHLAWDTVSIETIRNCYRKALDNALNIGDAQATDGDNTVDNDTVFCYSTEDEIPENDAELIEYLVNTKCIEESSSEKTDICIKKITSLNAMVMLEQL